MYIHTAIHTYSYTYIHTYIHYTIHTLYNTYIIQYIPSTVYKNAAISVLIYIKRPAIQPNSKPNLRCIIVILLLLTFNILCIVYILLVLACVYV